jgi:hypothetical protein
MVIEEKFLPHIQSSCSLRYFGEAILAILTILYISYSYKGNQGNDRGSWRDISHGFAYI